MEQSILVEGLKVCRLQSTSRSYAPSAVRRWQKSRVCAEDKVRKNINLDRTLNNVMQVYSYCTSFPGGVEKGVEDTDDIHRPQGRDRI
jgi:hypothetical protein